MSERFVRIGIEIPLSLYSNLDKIKNGSAASNRILEAVKKEKDELMKALAYDRGQYNKGYEDAKRAYERPKGVWLEWEDERWGGVWHYCSNCHNDALYKRVDGTFKQILSDYCPNCGAKMKEAEDEDSN